MGVSFLAREERRQKEKRESSVKSERNEPEANENKRIQTTIFSFAAKKVNENQNVVTQLHRE